MPKENLPFALTFGTMMFVALIYILYYTGLAGAVENSVLMENGEAGAKLAFSTVFSSKWEGDCSLCLCCDFLSGNPEMV